MKFIYIDQLKAKFEEIKEMLLEIDKEFSNSKNKSDKKLI